MLIEHVETNITIACNNACVGCNHFAPMQKPTFAEPLQIERDLAAFGKVAHIQRYALIGGEPTLHKRIDDILQIAKDSGTVDLIEVWTNGCRLKDMTETFWMLVDEIDLTLYPGKPVDLDFIQRKCAEYGKSLKVKRGAADFTTLLYKRTASEYEAAGIYRSCWYRTFCRVLDNGFFYRCCTSPFIPKLILGKPEGTDGIALEGLTELNLYEYLTAIETPESCRRCAGHGGAHIGWKEQANRAKWLEESEV